MLTVLLIRPASLILLLLAIFYLWIYLTSAAEGDPLLSWK
jgi:hypothetical protein